MFARPFVLVGLLLIVISELLQTPINARAAEQPLSGIQLRVSPLVIEEAGFPGEVLHATLEIRNISATYLPLHIYSRDVSAKDEYGNLGLENINPDLRAESWLHTEQTDSILEPKSATLLDVTTTIPVNTPAGDRSVALFLNPTTPDSTNESTGVAVQTQIASVFFITVKGATVEKGQISSFNPPTPHGAQQFSIQFLNEGNVRSKLTGLITITSLRGKVVDTLSTEKFGSLTSLPGKTRSLNIPWQGVGGIYQATLQLRSSTGLTYIAHRWFFVTTDKQLALAAIGLLLLCTVVYSLIQLTWRRNRISN